MQQLSYKEGEVKNLVQVQSLIPREVEIQRLKKIYIMVILMYSLTLSAGIAYYVDTSLNQTIIRDSAFTPANWLMYSIFIALPLGWAYIAIYSRRVPILRGPSNSINTSLKVALIGFLAAIFAIPLNELWHFWFVEEIAAVPPHWIFNIGIFVGLIGSLAFITRAYARLIELGAETPPKNPYVAEMYKLALEGKLYSRTIP
jgi:methane/ammonia monooxygenase subunit C